MQKENLTLCSRPELCPLIGVLDRKSNKFSRHKFRVSKGSSEVKT
jgi:hypothetical protein